MARKKSPDEETIVRLEKELREQKNLNRSLMKRLKKVDRGFQSKEDEDSPSEKELVQEEKFNPDKCPECSHDLAMIKIVNRSFKRCANCSYRTKSVKT